MPSYYLNEAVCDLPERTFVDKTIHALEATLRNGKTVAVFVQRRPVEGDKTLTAVVDDNVTLNRMRLSGFTVLERAGADVAGLPAVMVKTRWRQGTEALYQVQAHAVFEGMHLIFAVSGPLEEQAICDQTCDAIVATIAWRTA